jgi:hypothetical protein
LPPLCTVAVSIVAVPVPEQFGVVTCHSPDGVPDWSSKPVQTTSPVPEQPDGVGVTDGLGEGDGEGDGDGEWSTVGDGDGEGEGEGEGDGDGEGEGDGDGDGEWSTITDGEGDGEATPPHGTPFSDQSEGVVRLLDQVPWNPKSATPPVASEPFHAALVAVTVVPDWLTWALQALVICSPVPAVQRSVHPLTAGPRLVSRTEAVKPPGHWLVV